MKQTCGDACGVTREGERERDSECFSLLCNVYSQQHLSGINVVFFFLCMLIRLECPCIIITICCHHVQQRNSKDLNCKS